MPHSVEKKNRNIALFPEENPFPVLRVNRDGLLLYANRATNSLLARWQCEVGQVAPDFIINKVSMVLEKGQNHEMEIRSGDRQFSFSLVPISERGYVNFYGRDITEAKIAEKKLKESESRYRELVENANSAIIRWKADGTLTFFNEYAQKLFGYTSDEIIGKHVSLLLPIKETNDNNLIGLAQDIINNPDRYVHNINENVCRDGRRLWMAWTNKPFWDKGGEVYEILAIGTDITDRINTEIALRKSEERFRQLADSMPQLVWTADSTGNIDYCNKRFQEIKGLYQNHDGFWEWTQVLHPDDRDRTILAWQNALHGGSVYQIEHRVQRADGHFRWSLTRARPVRKNSGDIVKWYGTTTDIDDLKQAEKALAEAKEVAEDANRAKSEFLANISHEIRTPITVFKGAIEFLLDRNNNSRDLQMLNLAEQSVQRLGVLVDELLDLAKIEASQMVLVDELFDIRDCIKEAVTMMSPQAKKKNLHLEMRISPNIQKQIVGDQYRIVQVLLNLIGNSVKFTEKGTILVSAKCHDGNLEITVSDSGIGIPEEKLEFIFEPFNQLDASSTRKFGGAGLGLAISKGLVELMGGKITVKSTLGQGSVFSLLLPFKS